eukprot:jgi/Ulvmu1/698/UM010_0070.1
MCHGIGTDITQSFLDLTSLVAADTSSNKSAFDDLAYTIGNDAYADLNGWHLYLKDMGTTPGGPKMHQLLAGQLGTSVLSDRFDEKEVLEFLAKVPVKLGQGKANVSLDAVLPKRCVEDILRAVKDFSRDV